MRVVNRLQIATKGTPMGGEGWVDVLPRFHSAQGELRYRLNERLAGRNPGRPVNWRGL